VNQWGADLGEAQRKKENGGPYETKVRGVVGTRRGKGIRKKLSQLLSPHEYKKYSP